MGEAQLLRSPLAGLRVVEIANDIGGEAVGKLLGDAGAEVVKVEPPEGSPTRRIGPFAGDVADPDRSLTFWYYNTSKRGVTIDLTARSGHAALAAHLADADILVSTLTADEAARLGLNPNELASANPRLIVCTLTPFGLDGPWSRYLTSDLISLAAGGPLHTCGYDDLSIPPIKPGGDQASHVGASFALNGILLALIEREHTGRGQAIDASIHEACAVTVEMANPYWFYTRTLVRRQTCRHAAPLLTQSSLLRCQDGNYVYFVQIVAEQKPWEAFVGWLESEGLAVDLTDPSYRDPAFRRAHVPHIQEVVETFAQLTDARTLFNEAQKRGLPVGILYAPEDLLHEPHLDARDFFVTVEHPIGPVRYPGAPYRFTDLECRISRRAPNLGEHNAAIPAG